MSSKKKNKGLPKGLGGSGGSALRRNTKECSLCGSRCSSGVVTCDGCNSFHFCSKLHQMQYSMQHDAEQCSRIKQFLTVAEEDGFYSLPFSWMPKQTFRSRCDHLKSLGVHLVNPYKMECSACAPKNGNVPVFSDMRSTGTQSSEISTYDLKPILKDWWGDDGNKFILDCQSIENCDDIVNWETYLEYKANVADESIVSATKLPLILDNTMSIFWAIKRLLRNSERNKIPVGETVKVVLAGAEKEIQDQWPVLLELFNVLPNKNFEFLVAGPELPSWMHMMTLDIKSSRTSRTMKLSLLCDFLNRPPQMMALAQYHLVCALNAGLGAYPAWMDTLSIIKGFMGYVHSPQMFFFTDYIQESIEIGRKNIYMLFGTPEEYNGKLQFLGYGDIQHHPDWRNHAQYLKEHVRVSGILMNPFRKANTCVKMQSHDMPYASNGFGCFIELR